MCLHRLVSTFGFLLKKKKKGVEIFLRSENLLECSDRPHIVPTCSTRQFYRLREFQGDRSTLPHKKVDFLILGEDISLILVIEIPSKLEGVPGFSDFPKNLQLWSGIYFFYRTDFDNFWFFEKHYNYLIRSFPAFYRNRRKRKYFLSATNRWDFRKNHSQIGTPSKYEGVPREMASPKIKNPLFCQVECSDHLETLAIDRTDE